MRFIETPIKGAYLIEMEQIEDERGFFAMKDLYDVPKGNPEWKWDHPTAAAQDFADRHPEFALEQAAWLFNESDLTENVTHWPGAWLRRK